MKKNLEKYAIRRSCRCVKCVIFKTLKLRIHTNIILKFGPYTKRTQIISCVTKLIGESMRAVQNKALSRILRLDKQLKEGSRKLHNKELLKLHSWSNTGLQHEVDFDGHKKHRV